MYTMRMRWNEIATVDQRGTEETMPEFLQIQAGGAVAASAEE